MKAPPESTLPTDDSLSNAIYAAALTVFSKEELRQMSEPSLRSLAVLIERRLQQPGNPPTKAELEGIKELVTEHLWHPTLDRVPREPDDPSTLPYRPPSAQEEQDEILQEAMAARRRKAGRNPEP